ncbi:SDR family NAD(P)-dependent oxidoreductase [Brevibacillus sp. B_LB10_24]|uniref:SDR family NAD(P)-dependent oxidoreductase n=1 Tax=Brevibacillus sp. B_LB10_24 TaxID=3380645 RepID=UPI0038BB87E3
MEKRRTAIVTGGASGLGLAITNRFVEKGYAVAIVDIAEEKGRELVHQLREKAADIHFIAGNVADQEQARDIAQKAAEALGGIDILVNAAGIIRRTPAAEVRDAELMAVLQVNLNGSVFMCQAVHPYMKQANEGSIVNFSSMLAHYGSENLLSYAASKGGIVQVTKSLAVSWAKYGIRVNAVSPGYIETPLSSGATQNPKFRERILSRTPQGRYGKPEEVAAVVDFLASPEASFVTGVILPIDGGLLAGDPMLYPPATPIA